MYQLTQEQLFAALRASYAAGEWDRVYGHAASTATYSWLGEGVPVCKDYELGPVLEGATLNESEQFNNGRIEYLVIDYYTLANGCRAVSMGEGNPMQSALSTVFMLLSDYEYLPVENG